MLLAERIETIASGEAGAWEPYYRARSIAAAGEPITDLTIGDHDIKTDQSILNVMAQNARAGKTGYTEVPGIRRLREAIAERVQARTGVATTYRNVIITSGGQGALIAAHLAVLNSGDRAVYTDPYYPTYPGTIRAAGGTPIALRTRPENSFRPTAKDLAKAAKGAKSILFNSPNNPTGAVYPRETQEQIAACSINHDLWAISDEVYDTQIWNGEHISIRSLPNMEERTFVIGSMSKSFAMTGSRIGWLVAPADVASSIGELITVVTFGIPEYIQEAALFALEQGIGFENRIAEPFRRRRRTALDILASQNTIKLTPPNGAMYLMLDIRATGCSGLDFANLLLDQENIAVMPGESFGVSAAGHVRIAMTVAEDHLGSALRRMISLAERLASKHASNS